VVRELLRVDLSRPLRTCLTADRGEEIWRIRECLARVSPSPAEGQKLGEDVRSHVSCGKLLVRKTNNGVKGES
jgi:hypothetical protein